MDPIDMQVTDQNCEYLGLSRLCLMENAGKSLSDEVATLSTFTFSKPVKIIIFAGSGGNGGDGFVTARHLLNRGFTVDLYLLKIDDEIKSKDALVNLKILRNLNPKISRLNIKYLKDSSEVDNLDIALNNQFNESIIIDGILGTGIKGKIRPKERRVIEVINKSNALKISIDVPSGLNPLTGEIEDICVKADYTVGFHKVKTGVKLADEEVVGGLITCDIGIPIEAELYVGDGDLLKLKNRSNNSHKGDNGSLLIIGGSKEYSGAPGIAGMSAIAAGVDLVHVATPESAAIPIKSYSPDLIVHSLKGDYLNLDNQEQILSLVDDVDTVLIGPGASQEEETKKLFNILVYKIKKPIVLDADALKLVDRKIIAKKDNLVLTPHNNEFKQFYHEIIHEEGLNFDDLSMNFDSLDFKKVNDKITFFQSVANSIEGVTVVKGGSDFILQGSKVKINNTGNPGMTVGGTGDCLAGLTAGLLSQGLSPFDAASLATFLNGKAGDLAMDKYGYGYAASNLFEFIGKLMEGI
jgi:hydroxyethylthiazole kinase-like uncharacterized protein yjeF